MNTLKIFAIVAMSAGLTLVVTVFAQGKKGSDPKTHGTRLIMGHKNNEALHCTEKSLNDALSKCDAKAYKLKFHDSKDGKHWEKGELADVSVTDVTIRKDVGGPSPGPITGLAASGVHSTQMVSFGSIEELKAFVAALETN